MRGNNEDMVELEGRTHRRSWRRKGRGKWHNFILIQISIRISRGRKNLHL